MTQTTKSRVDTVKSVFATTQDFRTTQYKLYNSTILDSGATLHVFNDRTRFKDFRQAKEEDEIIAGNSVIPIEGFGTVEITVRTETTSGPIERRIQLTDTAYVPEFHTNVASFWKGLDRLYQHHRYDRRRPDEALTLSSLPALHPGGLHALGP